MNTPLVYLADLRYDYAGGVLTSDCMPLGIAYLKAVMDRDVPQVKSRLFAYPSSLFESMQQAPPDVVMLSNYLWNEELSLHFARLARAANPNALVVLGGPNIPMETDRQTEYVRNRPEIDLYINGEGDFFASEVVQHFLDVGMSRSELGKREIRSCIYRRPDGEVVNQPLLPRHRSVDEIPSPWLSGIQDHFFDGRLAPMIETNRGCPFTCTFCVQGLDWYTKVHYFDKERIKEEVHYIARKITELSPNQKMLRIADANYGMFERDVELSGWIGEMQKRYGYPTFIDATTGKNRPERIIESVEKVSGALVVYQAVQSLNQEVLVNIRRQNISLESYSKVMIHVRGRGLRSNSDLIIGLPGETLASHLQAISDLIDSGTNQMHNLQLILLKGSELEKLDTRSRFTFDARWRVGPKNFGIYGGEKVFDVEEVVVATSTLPFEDYLTCRKYHLVSSVFWNDSWFENAVSFAQKFDIRRSEWFRAMLPAMEDGPKSVQEFLANFVQNTRDELFSTREACISHYSEEGNFRKLCEGDIGDNLMYRYRAIASFYIWPDICKAAMEGTKQLLLAAGAAARIPDFEEFWADFEAFTCQQHAHGEPQSQVLQPSEVTMSYDIGEWIRQGMPLDPTPFRLDEPEVFRFELTKEGAHQLMAGFKVWTPTLRGLTKMVTRIQMNWQVRDCRRAADSTTLAGVA